MKVKGVYVRKPFAMRSVVAGVDEGAVLAHPKGFRLLPNVWHELRLEAGEACQKPSARWKSEAIHISIDRLWLRNVAKRRMPATRPT